eukprot:884623-Rhodomonas_salina.1
MAQSILRGRFRLGFAMLCGLAVCVSGADAAMVAAVLVCGTEIGPGGARRRRGREDKGGAGEENESPAARAASQGAYVGLGLGLWVVGWLLDWGWVLVVYVAVEVAGLNHLYSEKARMLKQAFENAQRQPKNQIAGGMAV